MAATTKRKIRISTLSKLLENLAFTHAGKTFVYSYLTPDKHIKTLGTKTENVFILVAFQICVDSNFHSETHETPGKPENKKLSLLCLLITDFH